MKTQIFQLSGIALCGVLILLGIQPVWAQRMSKAEKAIYELTNSGLLDTYRDYRRTIEKQVALFKTEEEVQSARNWIEMRAAYQETAEAFEQFIYNIRNDLLDPPTRREIRKNTEEYVSKRLLQLDEIYQEHYLGKFLPTYTALSTQQTENLANRRLNGGGGGTVIAALLLPVSQATMKVIDFVEERKEEKLEDFKEVLEEEWIKPNRFKSWEEIR